jgi:hypothetical protein
MPAPLPLAVRWSIYVLTIAAWVAITLRAFVPGVDHFVTDEQSRLALLVACVGSLKWIARRMMHPAHELVTIGKLLGRAEMQRELEAENVTQLRPALRVVGERPTE